MWQPAARNSGPDGTRSSHQGTPVLTELRAGARLTLGRGRLVPVGFDQSTGISMPIYKSSEFKGFGFNYDQSQQPSSRRS